MIKVYDHDVFWYDGIGQIRWRMNSWIFSNFELIFCWNLKFGDFPNQEIKCPTYKSDCTVHVIPNVVDVFCRYLEVVEACALTQDFQDFVDGDMTEVCKDFMKTLEGP